MAAGAALVLRNYQVSAIERLREAYARGRRAPLLQLATGGGKTVVFAEVTRRARERGRRVLIIVHRRELVRQAAEKLALARVPHGIIAAGFAPSPKKTVQVGSVQTLRRRLASLGRFDLAVLDECHHARAETWRVVIEALPQARLLGVTATPARLDGKGLGVEAGGLFDEIVAGPPVAELIAGGYLSPVRAFVPTAPLNMIGARTRGGDWTAEDLAGIVDRPSITGDAVEHYRRRADHLPAIGFCVTVAHAEHVAEAFRAAGYRAACAHGSLGTAHRDSLIGGLSTGSIEVLTSCDLISEGLDVPSVGAVILLRPTKSLGLHLQQLGRGMRPAPGKPVLVVNDHVGNVLRHGLPEQERRWSLAGVEKRHAGELALVRVCPECGAATAIRARYCENCDFEFPRSGRREPDEIAGELGELTPEKLADLAAMSRRRMLKSRLTETELRVFAQLHGYRRGWVWHRLREQNEGAP